MSKKKNLLLIALLVLVVVGVAAVVLLTKNGKDDQSGAKQNDTSSQNTVDMALLGEEFSDGEAGVSMHIPKGWQLAPKNDKDPGSLTKFVQSGGNGTGGANGELIARKTSVDMDTIVRGYLEAAMDIHITPKLIANQDVRMGDKTVRWLAQEMPGPNGVSGRITQYIFPKNGTYYIAAFTMLSSDWEAQQPGIEASIKSLKITP